MVSDGLCQGNKEWVKKNLFPKAQRHHEIHSREQFCKHICSCCHRFWCLLPTSVTKLTACLSGSRSASSLSASILLPSSSAFLVDAAKRAGRRGSSKSLRRSREGQALYKDEGQLKTHRDVVALKRLAYPSSVCPSTQTRGMEEAFYRRGEKQRAHTCWWTDRSVHADDRCGDKRLDWDWQPHSTNPKEQCVNHMVHVFFNRGYTHTHTHTRYLSQCERHLKRHNVIWS